MSAKPLQLNQLTGAKKAAILLISLGPETSSAVLKKLKDDEIEQLTLEVFSTDSVPDEIHQGVLKECLELGMGSRFLQAGGTQYANEMLARAFGPARAEEIIDRLVATVLPQKFDFLASADAFQLSSFLQEEQPQAVALILAHLPPARSAEILAQLPAEMQTDIALRIAVMEHTPPEVIESVGAVLRKRLSGATSSDHSYAGGVDYLVNLLTVADRNAERSILEYLDATRPELADEVRNKMFLFEHIESLDDPSIQRLLRDVDQKDLAVALRGAADSVRACIFRNLSTRAAQMLQEEIDVGRPVRQQQVMEAQQRVVGIARRLDEAGEIVIKRGGDSGFI